MAITNSVAVPVQLLATIRRSTKAPPCNNVLKQKNCSRNMKTVQSSPNKELSCSSQSSSAGKDNSFTNTITNTFVRCTAELSALEEESLLNAASRKAQRPNTTTNKNLGKNIGSKQTLNLAKSLYKKY